MKHLTVATTTPMHPSLQGPDPQYAYIHPEDWALMTVNIPQPITSHGYLSAPAMAYLNKRAELREADLQRQRQALRDREPKWYE